MRIRVVYFLSCVAVSMALLPSHLSAQSQGTPAQNLSPGPYQILPVNNTSTCLDVYQANTANGSPIDAYSCNGNSSQQWVLSPITASSGSGYQIKTQLDGSCLEVDPTNTIGSGAGVLKGTCSGAQQTNQIWQIFPFGDNYELVSLQSGLCLDWNPQNSTQARQYACSQGSNGNQLWALAQLSSQSQGTPAQNLSPGSYEVLPFNNTSTCLDVYQANTANGTPIDAYSCNGNPNQQWVLSPINAGSGGGYQIKTQLNGSCLEVDPNNTTGSGAGVLEGTCSGAQQTNQIWQIFPFNNDYELVSLQSGLCLDWNPQNSSQARQYACSQGSNGNQLWVLAELAKQSDAFADSIGFVTHIPYNAPNTDAQGIATNTNYFTNFSQTLTLLQGAGVRHIRDGYYSSWTQNNFEVQNYHSLAAAGIDLTLSDNDADTGTTVSTIENLAGWVGNLAALEGKNECDHNTCIPAAVQQLPILQQAGAALKIPVLGLSLVASTTTMQPAYQQIGNISSYITYNNIHCYYGGRNPDATGPGWGGSLMPDGSGFANTTWLQDQNQADAPGVPDIVTETGYSVPPTPGQGQASEAVQASYLPRTFLENFGYSLIRKSFAYEFLDEAGNNAPSSDYAAVESWYGVVRPDMSTKPAYTAIKNLIALTADPGSSFQPVTLRYTITGQDSTFRHLLLQKRNGDFYLFVWLEQSSLNQAYTTPVPVSVTPQNVTLTILSSPTAKTLSRFDATGAVTTTSVSGSTVTFSVTDQVTAVRMTN